MAAVAAGAVIGKTCFECRVLQVPWEVSLRRFAALLLATCQCTQQALLNMAACMCMYVYIYIPNIGKPSPKLQTPEGSLHFMRHLSLHQSESQIGGRGFRVLELWGLGLGHVGIGARVGFSRSIEILSAQLACATMNAAILSVKEAGLNCGAPARSPANSLH